MDMRWISFKFILQFACKFIFNLYNPLSNFLKDNIQLQQ